VIIANCCQEEGKQFVHVKDALQETLVPIQML